MNKSNLVTNLAANQQNKFVPLVCNLLPGKVRFETLEGREHLVVPMVMMTEGVHNGSGGAYLYNQEELSKTPQSWNYKPVVVYHPERNGQGISACDPTIINSRKIGVIMNTAFDSKQKRLVAEAWIEKDRVTAVDDRIMAAIERNEMMEVSTGVFVDLEANSGKWNDEEYIGIARNFRPDHLAVLPDKIGACSIADGAGLLRNEASKLGKDKYEKLKQVLKEIGVTMNEMSFSNIQGAIQDALRARFNVTNDVNGPWLWVENVYSNFVIYEYDNKLFRLGYTANDTGVSLSSDQPTEVVRVTEYRTVEGAFVGNRDQTKKVKVTMDANQKKKVIDALIANQDSGWSEEDRPGLEAMKDEQLQKLEKAFVKNQDPAPKKEEPKKEDPAPTPTKNDKKDEPANNAQKPFNYQEWMNQAPPQVQDFVNNGVRMHNDAKGKIVTALLANKSNRFSQKELEGMSLETLENLSALAGNGQTVTGNQGLPPNYSGNAPVVNAIKEEPMGLPTWNFAAK